MAVRHPGGGCAVRPHSARPPPPPPPHLRPPAARPSLQGLAAPPGPAPGTPWCRPGSGGPAWGGASGPPGPRRGSCTTAAACSPHGGPTSTLPSARGGGAGVQPAPRQ